MSRIIVQEVTCDRKDCGASAQINLAPSQLPNGEDFRGAIRRLTLRSQWYIITINKQGVKPTYTSYVPLDAQDSDVMREMNMKPDEFWDDKHYCSRECAGIE